MTNNTYLTENGLMKDEKILAMIKRITASKVLEAILKNLKSYHFYVTSLKNHTHSSIIYYRITQHILSLDELVLDPPALKKEKLQQQR